MYEHLSKPYMHSPYAAWCGSSCAGSECGVAFAYFVIESSSSELEFPRAMPPRETARTFVDLRKFAEDKSQGIQLDHSAGEDSFLSSRRILDFPPGPVTAGVIALEAGEGVIQALPADEFIVVSKGAITLMQQDRTVRLGPNCSAILQRGATFTWTADVPVSLIFMRNSSSLQGDCLLVPVSDSPRWRRRARWSWN